MNETEFISYTANRWNKSAESIIGTVMVGLVVPPPMPSATSLPKPLQSRYGKACVLDIIETIYPKASNDSKNSIAAA